MKISYSVYELYPISQHLKERYASRGVLLRFDEESFSLYHPIEALGDQSLKVFLQNMTDENKVFARVKAAAVSQESFKSLLNQRVDCYLSVPSLDFLANRAEDMSVQGYQVAKLKVPSLLFVTEKREVLENLPFRYIFDFSGKEKASSFYGMPSDLKDFFQQRVDYIEDPDPVSLGELSFKVAADFIDYKGKEDFKVYKPTRFNTDLEVMKTEKAVVTSYLDHPLGQLIAARFAAQQKVSQLCGVMSHTYYEPTAFSEILGKQAHLSFDCVDDFFNLLKDSF